jgi:hypothetical protein
MTALVSCAARIAGLRLRWCSSQAGFQGVQLLVLRSRPGRRAPSPPVTHYGVRDVEGRRAHELLARSPAIGHALFSGRPPALSLGGASRACLHDDSGRRSLARHGNLSHGRSDIVA